MINGCSLGKINYQSKEERCNPMNDSQANSDEINKELDLSIESLNSTIHNKI